MEGAVTLSVPVICDPEIGRNWWDVDKQNENEETGELEPVSRFLKRVMRIKEAA
jgi:hypothetical protein